jgi:hypothetical protein
MPDRGIEQGKYPECRSIEEFPAEASRQNLREFPVFFPVPRKLVAETGSLKTASIAKTLESITYDDGYTVVSKVIIGTSRS